MHRPVHVALVDGEPRLRRALAALVAGTPGFRLVGSFPVAAAAAVGLAGARVENGVAILVADDGGSAVESIRTLLGGGDAIEVLVLAARERPEDVLAALGAGAAGFLLQTCPPAALLDAIRLVADGGSPLTLTAARTVVARLRGGFSRQPSIVPLSAKERSMLESFARGLSYRGTAASLGISVDTVRFHVRNSYAKLGVHSKSEAVGKAIRYGLIG